MKTTTLTADLNTRLEFLEALQSARQLVHAKHCSLEEAAAALDLSPAALEAVSPDGFSTEDVADFLNVSHQYVSTLCRDAFLKIRIAHPELRDELRTR